MAYYKCTTDFGVNPRTLQEEPRVRVYGKTESKGVYVVHEFFFHYVSTALAVERILKKKYEKKPRRSRPT